MSAPPPAPAAAPVVHAITPKVPLPPPYNGEMGARLDNWRNQMEAYLLYTGLASSNDRRIVLFAATYLSGPAATWWRALPTAEKDLLVNWETFMAKLYRRFRPVHAATLARHQLTSLRQGAKQSVNSYSHAFLTALTPIEDMSAADQVHHYISGLRPFLGGKVFERNPTTLDAAMEAAVSVEASLNLGRSAALTHPSAAGPRSYYPSSSAAAGDAMDINNIHEQKYDEDGHSHHSEQIAPTAADPVSLLLNRMESMIDQRIAAMNKSNAPPRSQGAGGAPRTDRVAGLPPGEIDRRYKAGLCYRCGQPGHIKANCTAQTRSFQ